jgi:formyl-CoA transferase
MSAFNLIEHMGGHAFEPPIGPMGYTSVRSGIRRPQRTKDGYISLWPVTDAQWIRFFKLIGRPELADDRRFNSLAARARFPELVSELFDQVLPLKTTDEWIALSRPEDLPAAAVNTLEDLLADRHLASVNFWGMERHPTEGVLRTVASPISLSDSSPQIRRLAPRLGEHTREILKEFSFCDDEIDKLVAIGAAGIGAHNEDSGATSTGRAT